MGRGDGDEVPKPFVVPSLVGIGDRNCPGIEASNQEGTDAVNCHPRRRRRKAFFEAFDWESR